MASRSGANLAVKASLSLLAQSTLVAASQPNKKNDSLARSGHNSFAPVGSGSRDACLVFSLGPLFGHASLGGLARTASTFLAQLLASIHNSSIVIVAVVAAAFLVTTTALVGSRVALFGGVPRSQLLFVCGQQLFH